MSNPTLSQLQTFVAGMTVQHNGLTCTNAELAAIQAHIANGDQPWAQAYANLLLDPFSATSYVTTPVTSIVTQSGSPNDEANLCNASIAAYAQALRGYFSGDTSYYASAAAILDGWSSTLQTIRTTLNWYLDAGWSAVNFCNAAEILRNNYPSWTGASQLSAMFNSAYLPIMNKRYGYSNREWSNIAGLLAIGVFNNDRAALLQGFYVLSEYIPLFIYMASDGPAPAIPNWWSAQPTMPQYWAYHSDIFPSQTVTISTSTSIVSCTAHGHAIGARLAFLTTGVLPTSTPSIFMNDRSTAVPNPINVYVIAANFTADQYQVSLTPGGSAIAFSGSQSGVHSTVAGDWLFDYLTQNGNFAWEISSLHDDQTYCTTVTDPGDWFYMGTNHHSPGFPTASSSAAFVSGLSQEVFRELAHAEIAVGSMMYAIEIASNQGVDFWTPNGPRLTAGCEFLASTSFSKGVPPAALANSGTYVRANTGGMCYELAYKRLSALGYSLPLSVSYILGCGRYATYLNKPAPKGIYAINLAQPGGWNIAYDTLTAGSIPIGATPLPFVPMWPPGDGSRNVVSFDGRTYSSTPAMPVPVQPFDVGTLEANGWRKYFLAAGATLVSATLPLGNPGEAVIVNGRTYSTAPGTDIQVLPYDMNELEANGFVRGSAAVLEVPVNIAIPIITGGPPQVGQALSASPGLWLNAPSQFNFQWSYFSGADIPGATSFAYTPVLGDVGRQLAVRSTAINAAGSSSPVSSSATIAVTTASSNPTLVLVLDMSKAFPRLI